MLNLIKTRAKEFAVMGGFLLVMSFYLALMIRHLMLGTGAVFNPITLLKDIGEQGFPFQGTLVTFAVLVGFVLLVVYKSSKDSLEEDERNFKYSSSGVYGTAGMLKPTELKGFAKIETPRKAEGTILGQLDQTGKKLINVDLKSRMNKHIAVFGASGAGKSRSFAIPLKGVSRL